MLTIIDSSEKKINHRKQHKIGSYSLVAREERVGGSWDQNS